MPLSRVQSERFGFLEPAVYRLVCSWFDRAWNARKVPDNETFEPFIYCWIAFNAWAACVTGQDRDAEIIKLLSSAPELERRFEKWLSDDGHRNAASAFREWWPIFRAQHLRRQNLRLDEAGTRESRRERILEILSKAPAIQRSPCNEEHPHWIGSEFPLTWSNVLPAIYRVRCNLFHGDKCISSETDSRIVGSAFRVLVDFFGTIVLSAVEREMGRQQRRM